MQPTFTVSSLQNALGENQVRIVELGSSASQTVDATQLTVMYPGDAPVTPNGHGESYTLYLHDHNPVVFTPVKPPSATTLPWTTAQ